METTFIPVAIARYDERLTADQIKPLAWEMLKNINSRKYPPSDSSMGIIESSQIHLGSIPDLPIVKMAQKRYVDSFFNDGTLRLGTYDDFAKQENEEVQDDTEGGFLLIGQYPTVTTMSLVFAGFNQYAFCCYAGEPDRECIEKFEYDDAYIIRDVDGFVRAVAESIGAESFHYSLCVYSEYKALITENNPGIAMFGISSDLIEVVGMEKYFIKPKRFSHQCEFRFVWSMPENVRAPKVFKCPKAIQFCERVDIKHVLS